MHHSLRSISFSQFHYNPSLLHDSSTARTCATSLQGETGETNAEAGQETVNKLLHESQQVVHNVLEAEQEAREGSDERVEGTKEGSCVMSVEAVARY